MGILTAGRHVDFVRKHLPDAMKPPIKQAVKSYRMLTNTIRVRPDFIIIGARKCGTTSLYSYMARHPLVLPALKKEVFYFSDYFDKGESWYRSHFPTAIERWAVERVRRHEVITGEATPSYILNPDLPNLIYKMNPKIKLIAILRNPVDALYSAYEFGIKTGTYKREEVVFEKIVKTEIEAAKNVMPNRLQGNYAAIAADLPLLSRGLYVDMLEAWYKVFPPRSIQIIISESLFNKPQETMDRLWRFLSLPSHSQKNYERRNANNYSDLSPMVREMLTGFFAPYNRRLQDHMGIKTGWEV